MHIAPEASGQQAVWCNAVQCWHQLSLQVAGPTPVVCMLHYRISRELHVCHNILSSKEALGGNPLLLLVPPRQCPPFNRCTCIASCYAA